MQLISTAHWPFALYGLGNWWLVTTCSRHCTSDECPFATAQTVVSCTCSCGKCCTGCLFCGVFQHGSFISSRNKCGAQAICALLTSSSVWFLLVAANWLRLRCGTALPLPLWCLFHLTVQHWNKTVTVMKQTATTWCIFFRVAEHGGCQGCPDGCRLSTRWRCRVQTQDEWGTV